jgi:hypothetical protein
LREPSGIRADVPGLQDRHLRDIGRHRCVAHELLQAPGEVGRKPDREQPAEHGHREPAQRPQLDP